MESFQTFLKEVHLEKLTCLWILLLFWELSYKFCLQVIVSILLKHHQQNLMQLSRFATGFFYSFDHEAKASRLHFLNNKD